jgi:hypothetical protein
METGEDGLPKRASHLPNEPISLGSVIDVESDDTIQDVWIPRCSSADEVDLDTDDVYEAPWGFVPLKDITEMYAQADSTVLKFEFDDGQWYITEQFDRDDVPHQAFLAIMKPYVGVRRLITEMEQDGY